MFSNYTRGICLIQTAVLSDSLLFGITYIIKRRVGDVVHSLLTTGNALYSPIFLQSHCLIYESGSDNPIQRYGHSKFSKMVGAAFWI